MLTPLLLGHLLFLPTQAPVATAWNSAVQHGFTGGGIVVSGGKILFSGLANGAAPKEFRILRNTHFPVCSVTKAMTTQIVFSLVQEGKLSVSGKVGDYLPWAPPFTAQISLSQLLTHTSGIRNMDTVLGPDEDGVGKIYRSFDSSFEPLKVRVLKFLGDKLVAEPGSKYDYNNTDFILLQAIAEEAAKSSFQTLLQDRVFRPAGMRNSFLAEWNRPRSCVDCFSTTNGKSIRLAPFNMAMYGGSAGVISTPDDIAKWIKFTLTQPGGKSLLVSGSQFGGFQGFGGYAYKSKAISKLLGTDRNEDVFERPGAVNGYSLQISFLPERNIAVAVFSNREGIQLGSVFEGKGLTVDLLVAASRSLGAAAK